MIFTKMNQPINVNPIGKSGKAGIPRFKILLSQSKVKQKHNYKFFQKNKVVHHLMLENNILPKNVLGLVKMFEVELFGSNDEGKMKSCKNKMESTHVNF